MQFFALAICLAFLLFFVIQIVGLVGDIKTKIRLKKEKQNEKQKQSIENENKREDSFCGLYDECTSVDRTLEGKDEGQSTKL